MFERGYKTWCENVSLQMRRELKLRRADPLQPAALADHMGVTLLTPGDIHGLPVSASSILTSSNRFEWYALTVTANGRDAVIYNPAQSPGRQSSDITHELAHILAGHEPSTVLMVPTGETALRTFDRRQEDEANWLMGCLLLPRPALFHIAQFGLTTDQATASYGISAELLQYRLNVTGVTAQFRRRRS